MQRRQFLAVLAGTTAWSHAAHLQQADRVRKIGVLMGYAEGDREGQAFVGAFREGLQKLGWVEGHNIRIDARWGAGSAEPTEGFAKELVALMPDVILSHSTVTTAAILKQTRTIPVIFANVTDPIGSGFVSSFLIRAATPPVSSIWKIR
jgi:putative ABC transport system substrate-binding protein